MLLDRMTLVSALALVVACGGKTTGSDGAGTGGRGGSSGDGETGGPPSPSPTASGSAPAECSNGPRYAPGTTFPFSDSKTAASLPACVNHCGPVEHGGSESWPTISSLPSGTCTPNGYACQMAAEYVCACAPGQKATGPYSGFECTCTGGQWQCAVYSQGMSICACDGQPPGH